MLWFNKSVLCILALCLVSWSALSAVTFKDVTPEGYKYLARRLKGKSAEQLDRYLTNKLEPLMRDQVEKYHPELTDTELVIGYCMDLQIGSWSIFLDGTVHTINIPYSFISSAIVDGERNTDDYWWGIASLHHELTHMKKEHCQEVERSKGWLGLFICYLQNGSFYRMRRRQEWEADEGIPNERRMLSASMKHFLSSYDLDEPQDTHPTDRERGLRFKERLNALLESRNRNARAFLGLSDVQGYPFRTLLSASKMLGVNSDRYEAMLDRLGEVSAC